MLRHQFFAHRYRVSRRAVLLVSAVLGAIVLALVFRSRAPEPVRLSYTELVSAMQGARVSSVTIQSGRQLVGQWRAGAPIPPGAVRNAGFVVVYPSTDVRQLLERAETGGVHVDFEPEGTQDPRVQLLISGLSLAIVLGIGIVAFVQLRSRSGGTVDTANAGDAPDTTFENVAGAIGAVTELREIVEFLKAPERFEAVGARIPKGALLVGPPGTGKTLLARAIAGEAKVPFFAISGSQITGFIVGLGAQRIRTLFRKARKHGGVIFIDEIDTLGGKRGRAQGHNEDDRTLNQLLVEMDGFSPSTGVVVIGATNRVEDLDAALRRPGRFDRQIVVSLPTVDDREAILRLHVRDRGVPLSPDVDLRRLATLMPQTSGADLANLVNEAAIAAARNAEQIVSWSHFESARDRVLLGKEHAGFRAAEDEWRTVAYHEAGHALLGMLCCPEDGLHKVTIQPRGQAMGVAHFAPDGDRHLHSRRYLEGVIVKCLGGRAAEEIVFGADAVTSGARSDLDQVNRIARSMVYQLGMGESASLVVHDGQPGSVSSETLSRMDREVGTMIDRLYAGAVALLKKHRPALDALAQALRERETLDGAEAARLLEAHGVPIVVSRVA